MFVLYIIAAILAVLILIITCVALLPITVSVKYNGEFYMKAKVGFLTIEEMPEKKEKIKISDYSIKAIKKRQKKAAKAKAKATVQGASKGISKKKKERNLQETLALVKTLLAVVLPGVWNCLKIKTAKIAITVGSDDAAKTALLFSAINNSVAAILAYLDNASKLKDLDKSQIYVRADFLADSIDADIDILVTLRVWQYIRFCLVENQNILLNQV